MLTQNKEWSCIPEEHLFDDKLRADLAESLRRLPHEDVFSIIECTLFVCYVNGEGSWHLSSGLIRGRAVVILDPADLKTPEDATITILHEAAHVLLGHLKDKGSKTAAVYRRQEDEAWAKVREWLPPSFRDHVDRAEAAGGGTNGQPGLDSE